MYRSYLWPVLLLAGSVLAGEVPIKQAAHPGGAILTDPQGMSLYVFDKDAPGKSQCYEQCARNWPPLLGKADDTGMGDDQLIQRQDGSMQWSHKGRPLYRWINDRQPGDTGGDGIGGIWHLARP